VRAALTTPPMRKSKHSVHAALPVDHHLELVSRRVDVGHDLFDDRAENSFLEPDVRRWVVPSAFQIAIEIGGRLVRHRGGGETPDLELLDTAIEVSHFLQRQVPASLELVRDKPILGVHRIELSACALCGIPGFLEFQGDGLEEIIALAHLL
jgi:hypothetical protein